VDHQYIDEQALAEGYLDHLLPPEERREFEAHLVDCQECRDRLLLAEMFHARNGIVKPPIQLLEAAPVPTPIVTKLKPWGLLLFFAAAAVAAVLLLLALAGLFHWIRLG
jgi:hypothetical protein